MCRRLLYTKTIKNVFLRVQWPPGPHPWKCSLSESQKLGSGKTVSLYRQIDNIDRLNCSTIIPMINNFLFFCLVIKNMQHIISTGSSHFSVYFLLSINNWIKPVFVSIQELATLLFNDTMSPDSGLSPHKTVTQSVGEWTRLGVFECFCLACFIIS